MAGQIVEAVFLGGCITDLMCYAPRFPLPGETLCGTSFFQGCGGKGANSGYMAKKMGLNAAVITTLGNDRFGEQYRENLKATGMNLDGLFIVENVQSSIANIVVTELGQNSIVFIPGAIDHLTPTMIRKCETLFSQIKFLCCVFEAPIETVKEAFTIANKYNVTIYLNAAPLIKGFVESGVMKMADIICANEGEAEFVTGIQVDSDENVAKALKELARLGKGSAIITLGEKGAAFVTPESKTPCFVTIPRIKAVDTTGAGDAFNGSFAYSYVRHPERSFEEHVRCACAVASITVMKKGTQTSYPNREDIPAKWL